ncbi:armadillo-type protein [Globomyces pollinis-pini]|nr:armadillo-type protein [Globomyces pollinis-pini]
MTEFADPQLFQLLNDLLNQLSSQDNAIRRAAEEQLELHWVANQPGPLLAGLANATLSHNIPFIKSFSAVLLRRYALKSVKNTNNEDQSLLQIAGPQVVQYVQAQLVQSLQVEPDWQVRNKVADTTSQIASYLLRKKFIWSELFQLGADFVTSPNPALRRTAFLLFSGCPGLLTRQDQNAVKNMFVTGVQDQDMDVRLAALKATVEYICLSKQSIRKGLTDLLPLLLNVLPPVLANPEKETDAVEGITTIIELASLHPKMFKPLISQTVQFMLEQMKNTNLEDGTRQTCLELLITICEGAPGLLRKHEPFAPSIIPVMLDWMSELDDDQDWYKGETIEDDDESTNETSGEQAMDRLAIYLGGEIVLPIAFHHIPTMLASPDWQKRHAALRCISAIGEGSHDIMKQELPQIINLIVPHMRDPHPRVRHASCNAIGQLCTDFSPNIQNTYHEIILTNLIPIMDDLQYIRVANYAAAALVNFSEGVSKSCISPYIEPIISKLLVLMNTGKIFVQEQAVTTLATVADSAGTEFIKFYPNIMPVLLQILRIPNQKEFRSLKGKALECSSLIILAVGKEIFYPDSSAFIEVLREIQVSITDADDPQASYLLSAWARICKVLGADFAPYLEFVLPPLLITADSKPEMFALDAEIDVSDKYTEEDGWEIMPVGQKNLVIKTSALEDKCTAVEMLLCYAQEMGGIFAPYVEQIMTMVLPMLKFYLNDGVRYAAAAVIPALLNCWIKAEVRNPFSINMSLAKEKIGALWNAACDELLKALTEEEDYSIICTFYSTFSEGIKHLGQTSMTAEHMNALTNDIIGQLEQYLIRALERQKLREAEDYEPEDEEALKDEEFSDEEFLAGASQLMSTLLKTFNVSFLPFFDQMLSKMDEMINSPEPSSRQWALCVFCDVIEFTGEKSAAYQSHFLSIMGRSLSDPSADVRQAASYGAGVAAKFGGPSFAQFTVESLPHLFNIANDANGRADENLMATENAISAIGKIIATYKDSGAFDANNVITHWVASLPIVDDGQEAPETYTLLLDLIQKQHPAVVNQSQIPRLVFVLTSVLALPDLMPSEVQLNQQIHACLGSILGSIDAATKKSIWESLSEHHRQYLQSQRFV